MHLLVPNILFFRHLAGRALKKQLSAQGSNASSRSDGTTASNKRPSLDLALEDAAKGPNLPNEAVLKEITTEADFSHASNARSACIVQCPACKDQIRLRHLQMYVYPNAAVTAVSHIAGSCLADYRSCPMFMSMLRLVLMLALVASCLCFIFMCSCCCQLGN